MFTTVRLGFAALLLAIPATDRSQTKPTKSVPGQRPAQAQVTTLPSRLEIRLEPSREQLNAGEPLGIIGTLANISSDSTIYLTQQSVSLMLPPELVALKALWTWHAYFPSEIQRDSSERFLPSDSVVLALRPGQRMTLGWSASPYPPSVFARSDSALYRRRPPSNSSVLKTLWYFAFFTPDDYKLAVQAKYWTDSTRPRLAYSTATETVDVHVLAPQLIIVCGAALGGLIAYVMAALGRVGHQRKDPNLSRKERINRWLKGLGSHSALALLALIWSAVVAVLLSRTAEAQLPIRVTVADLWGAITIGIIAYYLGQKWLRKLTSPARD